MIATRHATVNGETTLCGIYGGWHNPKIMVKSVEGWDERVTCKRCRKSPFFKKEVAK